MERFEDYWGNQPNIDRIIARPLAEPTTRLAALRADEVDWIEVPPSDSIDTLEEEGYQLFTKIYPHVWPYQINVLKPPYDNKLVRQALNYAIDRESLCRDLLNGICIPSTGFAYPGHVSFGNPAETYTYDPDKAKALLEEAGVELPITFRALISTSGSGQMSPLPMNEFIQRNLKEVGVEMELVTIGLECAAQPGVLQEQWLHFHGRKTPTSTPITSLTPSLSPGSGPSSSPLMV